MFQSEESTVLTTKTQSHKELPQGRDSLCLRAFVVHPPQGGPAQPDNWRAIASIWRANASIWRANASIWRANASIWRAKSVILPDSRAKASKSRANSTNWRAKAVNPRPFCHILKDLQEWRAKKFHLAESLVLRKHPDATNPPFSSGPPSVLASSPSHRVSCRNSRSAFVVNLPALADGRPVPRLDFRALAVLFVALLVGGAGHKARHIRARRLREQLLCPPG